MTSLNLDRLREVTGVFITESDFQVIELEYKDYLNDNDNQYSDNEDVAEQFIEEWKEEQKTLGTFTETSDGYIKYYTMEGADEVKISAMEYLDNLDMTSYHWENMCRSYWEIFKEILNTQEINKKLLSNILSEATISHDQIYQLQEAMKGRMEQKLR